MTDNYDYHKNRRPDRVYLSKSLKTFTLAKDEADNVRVINRPFRIVSKVIDSIEAHHFFKDGKEVSLRITGGGRQEIVAKFYEDDRGIFTLQLQKYTTESGAPHSTSFSFNGEEISVLYNFIRNIELLPITSADGARLDDKFVESIVLTQSQAMNLLSAQPELIQELLKTQITAKDIAELGHRREQVEKFKRLLDDESYFEAQRSSLGPNKRVEDVWQQFFEANTWIFGYGLNYFLNSPLDARKLEQVAKGHDLTGGGKRVDALLKTRGLISALSFGEIKTHKTALIKQTAKPYRPECWQISDELSGGIAQVQKTIQISLKQIGTRLDLKEDDGSPSGEHLHLYQPKAFLIIGSLAEFQTEHGLNEDKYSSFELFRKNVSNPEIITFDELYERASFIVESTSR
jgi:hypothetical protein